jgi:NADP-dependent 3-hydroxy acid dehydrogenase YdfG
MRVFAAILFYLRGMEKVILITGATSGFGMAMARTFAAQGHAIIITGRREDRLHDLQHNLEQVHPGAVLSLPFDVRNEQEVTEAVEKALNWKGHIDVLINNAGLAAGRDPIDTASSEDWNQMIDTNVKGLLWMSKYVAVAMKRRGQGHIVNIGSIAGKEAYGGGSVYCASKFAVEAITQSMRVDLLPFGIKVSQVCPGAANTDFSLVRFKGDQEKANAVYQGFIPLNAQDIADAVDFIIHRPTHVSIHDMVIMPAAQASSLIIHKP